MAQRTIKKTGNSPSSEGMIFETYYTDTNDVLVIEIIPTTIKHIENVIITPLNVAAATDSGTRIVGIAESNADTTLTISQLSLASVNLVTIIGKA